MRIVASGSIGWNASCSADYWPWGRTLLTAFVAGQGDGDAGAESKAADGRRLRRLKEPHVRRCLSTFGELLIRRRVDAELEKQQIERVPLDEWLGLPVGEFSYVPDGWLQRLCVKESFHGAVGDLHQLLGVTPSERAAEQFRQRLAEHAEAFGEQSPPPSDEEAECPRGEHSHHNPLPAECNTSAAIVPASKTLRSIADTLRPCDTVVAASTANRTGNVIPDVEIEFWKS